MQFSVNCTISILQYLSLAVARAVSSNPIAWTAAWTYSFFCNISKTSASVSTRENWWKHEAAGRVLLLFSSVWNPDETRSTSFLKLLLQQKKISLNYHLNKVSQFNYYIWDVKCAWCAWSYHLTAALWQFLNIHQLMSRCYLPSCLSVLSEHVASQSKWQSADLDLLKLAKKRKSVCSALFIGNVCIWSDKFLTSVPF